MLHLDTMPSALTCLKFLRLIQSTILLQVSFESTRYSEIPNPLRLYDSFANSSKSLLAIGVGKIKCDADDVTVHHDLSRLAMRASKGAHEVE